jgi:uncharacterized protein
VAADDDLNVPLGTSKRPKRRLPDVMPYLAGLIGIVLLVPVAWVAIVDDPLGGEPSAIAKIERQRTRPTTPTDGTQAAPQTQSASGANASGPAKAEPGEQAGKSGPLIIKVPPNGSPKGPFSGVDPALSETVKQGALPKIGEDGRRPLDVYSSTSVAEAEDRRPKVALLIGGLGIADKTTEAVIEKLPGQITLGFTPYGADLQTWINKARAHGHEIMLQIPMEPFDYPNNDPGPQTLLTALPTDANIDRLKWVMSRFGGYFGVTNLMGAKFIGNEEALMPILTETARRGLAFLDTGVSPRSVVSKLATDSGASVARAEMVIDETPEAAMIDAALARLEDRARNEGSVIGVASALPVTLTSVERWAAGLNAKGISLVPVSAVVKLSNPS